MLSRCSIALTRSWIRGPQWRAVAQVVRESLRARVHPSLWVRVRGCICPPRGRNSRHATGGTESKTPRNSLLEHVPDSDKLESGTGKGERPRFPANRDGDGARSRSTDKSGTSTPGDGPREQARAEQQHLASASSVHEGRFYQKQAHAPKCTIFAGSSGWEPGGDLIALTVRVATAAVVD